MPAKFVMADESRDSRTAEVFASKSLKVEQGFTYVAISSTTATAALLTAPGRLHSVIFTSSAAGSYFTLYDSSSTAAAIGTVTANAFAFTGNGPTYSRVFDVILTSGLTYRLSGGDGGGIILTYTTN
jgi:hypothetical protein